jgi:AAA+ ATPase superfamily predicted ATPase
MRENQNVIWTAEQDAALKAVDRWMRTSEQIFRLFGFAGVGKTTLIKHFAEHIDGDVAFVSFTGKAASVKHANLEDVNLLDAFNNILGREAVKKASAGGTDRQKIPSSTWG